MISGSKLISIFLSNKENKIQHPELDITSVDLAELYYPTATPSCNMRNVVIFGGYMADRSPYRTGTIAKLDTLYKSS